MMLCNKIKELIHFGPSKQEKPEESNITHNVSAHLVKYIENYTYLGFRPSLTKIKNAGGQV